MVNVLIGYKDNLELNVLSHNLANEKNYIVERTTNGTETIDNYLKINPDILVLDDSLQDITIDTIVNRLSLSPIERKKCNTILTLKSTNLIKLDTYSKIANIIYKPLSMEIINANVKDLSNSCQIPDIEYSEIEYVLSELFEINNISPRIQIFNKSNILLLL